MENPSDMTGPSQETIGERHQLYDKWTLWAHLPHDTDWSIDSYKPIQVISDVETAIALFETLPDKLTKNCILFLMREGIKPRWEDPHNRTGGCFSYRIKNNIVPNAWKNLSYTLLGESLANSPKIRENINGITISPKRHFCIIKIWLANCSTQDPNIITEVKGLSSYGCLFKKHMSEY